MKLLFLLCIVFVCAVYYADCKGGGGRGGGGRDGDEFFNDMSKLFEALINGRTRSSSRSHISASSRHSGHGSEDLRSYRPPSGYSRYNPGSLYPYYPGSLGFPNFPNTHLIHEISFDNPRAPSHNTNPQYEYAKQYSSSTSRYNDLLTGLTMYNVIRSRSFRQHNYRDSFSKKSSGNSSSSTNTSQSSSSSPTLIDDKSNGKDEAICLMKIKENEIEEALKIPCAMVTTFGEGKRRIPDAIIDATATECVKLSMGNSTSINAMKRNYYLQKNESVDISLPGVQQLCNSIIKTIDPLSVTGPPLNTANMECKVEIWKEDEVISNIVNCKTLLQYAKMPMLGTGNIRSERPIPRRAFVPLKELMEDTDTMFSDLTRSNRRQIFPAPQDGDAHMSSLIPELKQTVKNHGLPSSITEDQRRFDEFMLKADQAFSSKAFPSLAEILAPADELRAYYQEQSERLKQKELLPVLLHRDADTISHRHPSHAPSLSSIMDEKRKMNEFWTNFRNREAMLQKKPFVTPREVMESFDELFANYGDKKPEHKVILPASRNMGDIKTTSKPAHDFVPQNWSPQSYLGSQQENQFYGLQTDE